MIDRIMATPTKRALNNLNRGTYRRIGNNTGADVQWSLEERIVVPHDGFPKWFDPDGEWHRLPWSYKVTVQDWTLMPAEVQYTSKGEGNHGNPSGFRKTHISHFKPGIYKKILGPPGEMLTGKERAYIYPDYSGYIDWSNTGLGIIPFGTDKTLTPAYWEWIAPLGEKKQAKVNTEGKKEKRMFDEIREFVKERRDWVFTIILVALVDHFLLDGALKGKLTTALGKKIDGESTTTAAPAQQ